MRWQVICGRGLWAARLPIWRLCADAAAAKAGRQMMVPFAYGTFVDGLGAEQPPLAFQSAEDALNQLTPCLNDAESFDCIEGVKADPRVIAHDIINVPNFLAAPVVPAEHMHARQI